MSQHYDTLAVTSVRVHLFDDKRGFVRAVASVVLNEQLELNGLRVFEDHRGFLSVKYPADPFYQGKEYREMFRPVDGEFRRQVSHAVLDEYARLKEADEIGKRLPEIGEADARNAEAAGEAETVEAEAGNA
jgi:DNA-binding cell septation regulator SpoVG